MVNKHRPPSIEEVDDADKEKHHMSSILDLGRAEYHDTSHLTPCEQHQLALQNLELGATDLADFDGTWASRAGLRHVVSGSLFSTGVRFAVLSADACERIEDGATFHGRRDGNTISWDNGEIWRRNTFADFRAAAQVDCQFTADTMLHDFKSLRHMRG